DAIGVIAGTDDDDAFLLCDAVHLAEESVDNLHLITTAMRIAVRARTDGIDLVDEQDAGRQAPCLGERFAHLAQHVAEMPRTLPDSEAPLNAGDTGAVAHRPRLPCLAGAGRAVKQHRARQVRPGDRALLPEAQIG